MSIDKRQLLDFGRKGLRIASEVANVAVQLRTDSGPLGWFSVGAKVANTILDQAEIDPFQGWATVSGIAPLAEFALVTAKSEGLVVAKSKQTHRLWSGTIHGVCFGWREYEQWLDGPYIPEGTPNTDAVAALRLMLWSSLGKSVKYFQPPLGGGMLVVDSIDETHSSRTAVDLWKRQEPYLAAGKRRSVLLVGEHGVGKSNIVRHVAEQAGGFRLRFRACDLHHLRSLAGLCRFLAPDAVVIDDIDRAEKPNSIIEEIDELLATARLVMVTANWVTKLDPGIVRRFDDFQFVGELDHEVLDQLLFGVPARVADVLRTMPVKYIDKYREAVIVLGHERAAAELPALVAQHELVTRMSAAVETPSTAATADTKPA